MLRTKGILDEQITKRSRRDRRCKYERFGEIIRHLTNEEMVQFFNCIDNYQHKLMFEIIYELGCRVGEFVRIQVKHIHFSRSTIFFPAENTKTRHARVSYLPRGLTNEIKSILRQTGLMNKRDEQIKKPDAYLFHPGKRWNTPYTENRIRQLFQKYIERTGLQRIYAEDSKGRKLKMFTVHSLRHTHVFTYVVDRKVPLPIVQKQVGHRSLKTTSVYLAPSAEKMAQAYSMARQNHENQHETRPYEN